MKDLLRFDEIFFKNKNKISRVDSAIYSYFVNGLFKALVAANETYTELLIALMHSKIRP